MPLTEQQMQEAENIADLAQRKVMISWLMSTFGFTRESELWAYLKGRKDSKAVGATA